MSNPTTGEWTVERIHSYKCDGDLIADINAALADEREKYEVLIAQFKAKSALWLRHSLQSADENLWNAGGTKKFDASRYEGISTGYRWAYEDLEKAMKE